MQSTWRVTVASYPGWYGWHMASRASAPLPTRLYTRVAHESNRASLTYISRARSFGLGAGRRKQNETTYTLREAGGTVTLGWWVLPPLMIALTERLRSMSIDRSIETALPFLRDKFMGLPGEKGAFV
jgi:hypothetical protein